MRGEMNITMRPNLAVRCVALLKRFGERRRGAISVEFALSAPILVALALVSFDFGRGVQQKHRLAGIAMAGAQLAVQRDRSWNVLDIDDIEQRVRDDAGGDPAALTADARYYCMCPETNLEVACGATCTAPRPPSMYVEVALRQDFDLFFPYPGVFDPYTLQATSTIRVR